MLRDCVLRVWNLLPFSSLKFNISSFSMPVNLNGFKYSSLYSGVIFSPTLVPNNLFFAILSSIKNDIENTAKVSINLVAKGEITEDGKTEKQKEACEFLRELAVFLLERNY